MGFGDWFLWTNYNSECKDSKESIKQETQASIYQKSLDISTCLSRLFLSFLGLTLGFFLVLKKLRWIFQNMRINKTKEATKKWQNLLDIVSYIDKFSIPDNRRFLLNKPTLIMTDVLL